ncbi:hypothetical protein [Bradyrhizobium sp. AUGA SZCCT0182]|uniref:hypothetical protein n=1 Tax=Bradyrhizobium sp. AUGA SZCCT0182 TaxID=2807667 RepID=UPI001BA92F57|nr:hypothetical protein [Bradyrhizobium sp. AUGA SZCCT0182]MBR1232857.1 hypothetical protein [Bradyrhizobium sp. AUGA SZCCT0182]
MQSDINADGIKRKEDPTVFGLSRIAAIHIAMHALNAAIDALRRLFDRKRSRPVILRSNSSRFQSLAAIMRTRRQLTQIIFETYLLRAFEGALRLHPRSHR